MSKISPFLDPGPRTTPGTLSLAHLSRENILPVYLRDDTTGATDGYAEGAVMNTRFGSFPHSTLLDKPWGSQIRASIVDTGSRGRKRKPAANTNGEALDNNAEDTGLGAALSKDLKTASSGFIHILPPTPEIWTSSLPHRTQVVYTPDYSYILHRIRARPGMKIIEAGAGSGSFTHASARAVYNGYPKDLTDAKGKVFSFEFNEDRYSKMRKEIDDHRLSEIVHLTHRDVYNDGFLIDGQSPEAECVFLDLPAPWKALPHLSRRKPTPLELSSSGLDELVGSGCEWKSPLRADRTVYLCTFSPCIEQVTTTINVMRRLGWMDIEMVEVAHKRVNVMRERIGMHLPAGDRNYNQSAANVAEAVARLKDIEGRFQTSLNQTHDSDVNMDDDDQPTNTCKLTSKLANGNGTTTSLINEAEDASSAKPWMSGRLIHRTEPEIKTHTSYLVFAVLPQEWTEAQEKAAYEKWPCGKESKVIGSLDKEARKQEKREMLVGKKRKRDPRPEGKQAAEPNSKKSENS